MEQCAGCLTRGPAPLLACGHALCAACARILPFCPVCVDDEPPGAPASPQLVQRVETQRNPFIPLSDWGAKLLEKQ